MDLKSFIFVLRFMGNILFGPMGFIFLLQYHRCPLRKMAHCHIARLVCSSYNASMVWVVNQNHYLWIKSSVSDYHLYLLLPGCWEKPGAISPVVSGVALHLRLPCVISSTDSVPQFFEAISQERRGEKKKKHQKTSEPFPAQETAVREHIYSA